MSTRAIKKQFKKDNKKKSSMRVQLTSPQSSSALSLNAGFAVAELSAITSSQAHPHAASTLAPGDELTTEMGYRRLSMVRPCLSLTRVAPHPLP